jgi:hypothetical protein
MHEGVLYSIFPQFFFFSEKIPARLDSPSVAPASTFPRQAKVPSQASNYTHPAVLALPIPHPVNPKILVLPPH